MRSLPGEGAFYGPKLEFHLRTRSAAPGSAGRSSSTRRMPQRLDATYVGEPMARSTIR